MRQISKEFISDLKNEDGMLHPLLKRVKQDHTLMLAIRNGYINIYYRGGNILQVTEKSKGFYETFFDKDYAKSGETLPDLPKIIERNANTQEWVNSFPQLKQVMDIYFSTNTKTEREFQQLVARENNNSAVSKESEYFITDIEFFEKDIKLNDQKKNARFDLLAIRWLASDRKDGSNCRAAFIEMKYGDSALRGASGMIKHLQDFNELISNRNKYKPLLETMESQFNQLHEFGLLRFTQSKGKGTNVELVATDKPEVIFILANHNPRSKILKEELEKPEFIEFGDTGRFDLRFFISSFAGYGLHSDCMFTLTQFRKLLKCDLPPILAE